MILHPERSALLVIDVQEKLLPAIEDGEGVATACAWLVRAAQRIGVPVAATEQYPEGLGHTVPLLRALLPPEAIAAKVDFSCAEGACLDALPGHDRPQRVLVGMETHVCVLQSALGLLGRGVEVYVVADAIGSRRAFDRNHALARMRREGVRIVTREMVVFEWLRRAGTPLFREVSREFLR